MPGSGDLTVPDHVNVIMLCHVTGLMDSAIVCKVTVATGVNIVSVILFIQKIGLIMKV